MPSTDDPRELVLGRGKRPSQSFDVWNCGDSGPTLSYTISDNATWLSCSPSSGTSTGEHDTVTCSYDTDGLTCGTYSATITISDPAADNNPRTIPVSMTVTCPPLICREPVSLTNCSEQGADAPAQTFEVWDCGAGTLS